MKTTCFYTKEKAGEIFVDLSDLEESIQSENQKAFRVIFAIVVLVGGVMGCERIQQVIRPATPQTQEPITEISIGVVLPKFKSGSVSNVRFRGILERLFYNAKEIISMFTLAALMIVLTFYMPISSFSQQAPILSSEIEIEAREQAIADAEIDTDRQSWFLTGCVLNIIGVVIAQMNNPLVPAERLIGKSPAYIDKYTSHYQAKRAGIQKSSALAGCLLAGCLFSTLAISVFAALGAVDFYSGF